MVMRRCTAEVSSQLKQKSVWCWRGKHYPRAHKILIRTHKSFVTVVIHIWLTFFLWTYSLHWRIITILPNYSYTKALKKILDYGCFLVASSRDSWVIRGKKNKRKKNFLGIKWHSSITDSYMPILKRKMPEYNICQFKEDSSWTITDNTWLKSHLRAR